MEALITALVTAFGTLATDAISGISQVAPVVLPVLAAVILIGVVIKVVRRVTGR